MKLGILSLAVISAISSFSSAYARESRQTIIFEEEVRTTRLIIVGGYEERHGDTHIVRSRRNREQGRIRIGSKVITSDLREGTVKAMSTSRDSITVYDSYYGNRSWSLDRIAVTNCCVDVFCVGDKVITSDERNGVVAGYFGDGRIVVKDSYYGNRTWSTDRVAVTEGCTDQLCVGDRVVTSDNRNGTVSGFHANGQVVVYDSYYGNRKWSEDRISLTEGVCANIYVERVEFCRR